MKKHFKWAAIFAAAVLICTVFGVKLHGIKSRTAEIYVDGQLYKRVSLYKNTAFRVETENGYNDICVENGAIYVSDADCADKVCVKSGKLTGGGLPIACLPHRLIIQINSNNDTDAVSEQRDTEDFNLEDNKKYPHSGHRKRMRERYNQSGFSGWAEHEVLEFILFDKIPRRDTNKLAHDILEKFGTIQKALEASEEQLCGVKGIGKETAKYLKTQKKMYDYCQEKKKHDDRISYNEEKFKKYLMDLFAGKNKEVLYMVCLDVKERIIRRDIIVEGNFESVSLDVGSMVRIAVHCDASSIVLAHNHPSGIITPSESDIAATRVIMSAMQLVSVSVANHFIVTDDACESMMNRYPFCRKGNNVHKKSNV